MVGQAEQDRVKQLLKETLPALCKSGLSGVTDLSIQALIGIRINNNDLFLVSIDDPLPTNKTANTPYREAFVTQLDTNVVRLSEAEILKTKFKRKRKRTRNARQNSNDTINTANQEERYDSGEDATYVADENEVYSDDNEVSDNTPQHTQNDTDYNKLEVSLQPVEPRLLSRTHDIKQEPHCDIITDTALNAGGDFSFLPSTSASNELQFPSNADDYQTQILNKSESSSVPHEGHLAEDAEITEGKVEVRLATLDDVKDIDDSCNYTAEDLVTFEEECMNDLPDMRAEKRRKTSSRSSIATPSRDESSEVKCDMCDYVTTHAGNLSRHMRVHTGEKYQCDKCEMLYSSKRVLLQHYQLVHGAPLLCDCCNKPFRSQSGLALHLKRMRGDYLFTCHICSKGFIEKVSYEGHMSKHAAASPFACECGKSYRYKCSYVIHKKDCKGKVDKSVVPDEIRCSFCEKLFNTKCSLKEHVIAKHGTRTYQCERCCETFRWRPSYSRHVRSCNK